MKKILLSMLVIVPMLSGGIPAYTNHAGQAVFGFPAVLSARVPYRVTFSNGNETAEYPLSIFPENERRRIAADMGDMRFIPHAIRNAVEGNAKEIRRQRNRNAKGLLADAEYQKFRRKSEATMKSYLDGEVLSGHITPAERMILDHLE